jgi:hypothetical protein
VRNIANVLLRPISSCILLITIRSCLNF